MEVQKFQGTTLKEALFKVKKTLGEDALILATRHVRKGGLFGFGASSWVEIEASSQQKRPTPPPTSLDHIKEEMSKLRNQVASFIRGDHPEKNPDPLYNALIQRGIFQGLARNLIEESNRLVHPNTNLAERALVVRDLLAKRIHTSSGQKTPKKPYICALIGPTGVGKTTTIAKLAARFKLEEKKSVGLFTLDTYRIAAVDQLRTYSEIIDLPFKVIHSPEDLGDARKEFMDRDLILVDTAGRSQKDLPKMKVLQGFLKALDADEIHLVLSATTGKEGIQSILDHFGPCGITNVILTKLDEASSFGHLVSILLEKRLPISYLACGQEVPDDLLEAKGESIAALIAGTGV